MDKLPDALKPLIANLPPDKANDIQAAIISSPYLINKLAQAMREDRLDHVRIDEPNAHRGGYYDAASKSIYIGETAFKRYPSSDNRSDRLDVITGILGHEVEHGFQKENAQRSLNDLSYQIDMKIRNPDYMGQADMTQNIGVYINAARKYEAEAEIGSWNAVASRVQNENNGAASQKEVLQRVAATTSCVLGEDKNIRPAPNLVLAPDFQLSDDRLSKHGPINREPVAQCYFDQKASDSGLGKGGKSDYTNYYGAIAFELIHAEMRDRSNPPLIAIDMQQLGLKPKLLESNGLNFHEGSLSFLDISPQKTGQITLHHGGSEKKNSPKEDMDEPQVSQRLSSSDPTQPQHPDHLLYQQALAGVKKHDAALGREPDENSLRLAASLTVLAKENGIDRIDNVVFSVDNVRGVKAGENVFIVQGELNNPAHDRAHMKTTEAITTSMSESFQKLDTINQQQAQQQVLQPNLEQTQTPQLRSLSM